MIRALTLESLGMNSNVIYQRCLPGGPWQRLLPGIIVLHSTEPTLRERLIAALLYCGPQALVTGSAACRQYGLRVPAEFSDAEIHMLVPHERKILSSEFVTVERTTRLPGAWIRAGLPLAPLVRATTDAVRRTRAEELVGRLLVGPFSEVAARLRRSEPSLTAVRNAAQPCHAASWRHGSISVRWQKREPDG